MAPLGVRQVLVGARPAGMHGQDELSEDVYAQGRQPDEPGLGLERMQQLCQCLSTSRHFLPTVYDP